MSNNTGGPAFPHHIEHPNGHWPGVTHAGISVRDYFAAKAMQGLLAGMLADGANFQRGEDDVTVATLAYMQADAMLKAREASNG